MAAHAGAITPTGHHDHRHIHFAPDPTASNGVAEYAESAVPQAYSSDRDRTSGEIPGFGMGLFALVPYAFLLAAVFAFLGYTAPKARATYGIALPLPHPPPRG